MKDNSQFAIVLRLLDDKMQACSEKKSVDFATCTIQQLPPRYRESLSGGCRAGLTPERCSQLTVFAIQLVG